MTASNCAKYDVQHGLIIFKDHSPLKYTKVSQATVFVQIIIRNNRKRLEIYSEFTVKATEQRHRFRSGFFIVNFEHISLIF